MTSVWNPKAIPMIEKMGMTFEPARHLETKGKYGRTAL